MIETLVNPSLGVLTFDVTDFVNTERLAGNPIVGFVFEETGVSLDGVADLYQIFDSVGDSGLDPTLTLSSRVAESPAVPEPASAGLIALGTLVLLGARRARNRQ